MMLGYTCMEGQPGQNCLKADDLYNDVWIDLTENGLVYHDYDCRHPYGPLSLSLKHCKSCPNILNSPFFIKTNHVC